jgi:hypothetical protein
LHKVGKLDALMSSGPARVNAAFANDSLSALTGNRPEVVSQAQGVSAAPQAAKPLIQPVAKAAPSAAPTGRGQGQLRLPTGNQPCVIKALTLKEASLLVRRGEVLPQILDSAVLDLEQGDNAEVARLNGYLHAIAAFEQKPDSEWLQLTFRFVDQDTQKLDYLSRLIARGTAQKHFVPGA